MHITVTFKHMDSSDAVKSHAESKILKLEKYLNNILEAHLTLSIERIGHKESTVASLKIVAKNLDVNVEEKSSDPYSAIDLLMDKIEPIVIKHKEKTRRKEAIHNGDSFKTAETGMEESDVEDLPIDLKYSDNYEKNPLEVGDALQKLRRKNDDFIIFKNKATSKIAFLVNGQDGIISLIEPDL